LDPGLDPPTSAPRLRLANDRTLATLATSLILGPMVLFAISDAGIITDPARLAIAYVVRALALVVWVAGAVQLRRARSREVLRRITRGVAWSIVLFMLAIQLARPANSWLVVRSTLVVSCLLFVAYPDRLRYQLGPWAVLAAGTMALNHWYYQTMTTADSLSIIMNFMMAATLGAAAAVNRGRLEIGMTATLDRARAALREREQARAALRRLEGTIPICVHCREVQTSRGAWERLEHLVHAQTDASFSHGICPDCMQRHFPFLTGADDDRD